MEFIGLPYKAVEDRGVLIPVLSADCEYKSPVRFDEVVKIYPEVSLFNGIRMQLCLPDGGEGFRAALYGGAYGALLYNARDEAAVAKKV